MGNYLRVPKTDKDIIEEHFDHLSYAFCSMQGWRVTMEDDHILEPNFDEDCSLFAIFDGHGGDEVAKFCSRHFGEELKQNANYMKCNYKKALEENFRKMDEMMMSKKGQQELNEIRNFEQGQSQAGCTALVVLITKKKLYVANAGDCRCLLLNTDGYIYQMNQEHKPEDDEEYSRIMNAGCFVVNKRVNETLNLSRALGDLIFKKNKELDYKNQIVVGHPDVVVKDLEANDQLIFLGCDGVFEKLNDIQIRNIIFEDLLDNQPMMSAVKKVLDQTLAPQLSAYVQYGFDNMSAILIKLNYNQTQIIIYTFFVFFQNILKIFNQQFMLKVFLFFLFLRNIFLQDLPLVKNGDIIDLEEENTYFLDNNQRQLEVSVMKAKLADLQASMNSFRGMTKNKLQTMKNLVDSPFFQKRKMAISYEKLDFNRLL